MSQGPRLRPSKTRCHGSNKPLPCVRLKKGPCGPVGFNYHCGLIANVRQRYPVFHAVVSGGVA